MLPIVGAWFSLAVSLLFTLAVALRMLTPSNFTQVTAAQAGSTFAKLAFLVQSDGDVQNKNNSYGQISDQRLKQDIADAASQWDDIKAVQVKKVPFQRRSGKSWL